MRTVAPEKPLDHAISFYGAAAAALLLAALTALPSQPATAQAAVPCTAIDDDEERLACYDRALRSAAQPGAPPPAAQAQPRSAPPAATPAPSATPPAVAEPRRERPVRDSAAPAARTPPAAPRAGADSGDEQILPIVVVGVRALPGRETTFTMQDGTSWVQTDSQRLTSLPDPPFDAELKPGVMGSYFLVAKDRARAIRVRPLR
jgi:hypothetical protein